MFPLNYGTAGVFYPIPYNLTNDRFFDGHLPEEVQEMIENKRDEIKSEDDIQDIVEEAYYRR